MAEMTDAERVVVIRAAVKPVLNWYRNIMENGSSDNPDEDPRDYLYDMTWDEFNKLSRGNFQQIIEALL